MTPATAALIRQIDEIRTAYGGDSARRKLELLGSLDRRALSTPRAVLRLHEFLCFLRAYPDDRAVLGQAERMLATFDRRPDLRRHRKALASTGIAGTEIDDVFFWFTAQWLVRRWPSLVSVKWRDFASRAEVIDLLHLLLPYSETAAVDEIDQPLRAWIGQLKGAGETDAAFLVRRFATLHPSPFGRETLYERIRIPLVLAPGPDTPSRTRATYPAGPPAFQTRPLDRSRPVIRTTLRTPPRAVRFVPPPEADQLIDLAREAMVTRARDLDNFIHADRHDVRMFEYGDGLTFACFGLVPERRLLLESVYGMLTLKNGVPIGYVLASALFGSSEVMYNVFETFRGGEAAQTYGRVLSMVRSLFGSDTFVIDPYQLGHGNREGQESGAFWFYYKLGFRPVDASVRRLVAEERRRLQRNPAMRSSRVTLQKLSADYVVLHAARPRRDVLGRVSLGTIGLHVSRLLAERFGADRERGITTCAEEASRLLDVRSFARWSRGERLAWERWSPLVLALPGVGRWPTDARRALVAVVRAKGGRRESEFVRLADAHPRLRRALLELAASPP